ncbi:MAG TPA: type VI secretion system baseplate subunit TssG [Stellaceae bacterium]|jgi:type VI secretion system protein ImpH|nr:type VI secretion system baseplate subunit TssG [Stellaceae bacterium]
MARSRRLSRAAVAVRLAAEPRAFGFFQAVRLLEWIGRRARRGPTGTLPVAEDADPDQRIVRFRAAPHLSYPASEIDGLAVPDEGPAEMRVNFIGLTGPLAVLPQHYTVTLVRELRGRNTALADFFDLFNSRLIAFFYRAWAKYRVPISVERGTTAGDDSASTALRALIGLGTGHLAGRTRVDQNALLHYSGMLSHFPRNPDSLEKLLADYFRLPVRIEPFDPRWLDVPPEQRSRLGSARAPGQFDRIGVDSMIGETYLDVQSSFAILIGPIGYAQFLELLPSGGKLTELAELVRQYADPQLGFRVELCLARDEVPRLLLDGTVQGGPRLGWNTWLRHYPAAQEARDARWHL